MKNFVAKVVLLLLVVSIAGVYFFDHRLCMFNHDKFATTWCYDGNGYYTRILFDGKGRWLMLTDHGKSSVGTKGSYTIRDGQLFAMIDDKIVFRAELSSCEQLHIYSSDGRFIYFNYGNFTSPCHAHG